MNQNPYQLPKVWTWKLQSDPDNKFANINRPVSGSTQERKLPVGKHPFQLYSLATPNGMKVPIMFEELLESKINDADYDAWYIDIEEGDQFGSGFVAVNPNSKIPALMDHTSAKPTRVFESGAILLHLAEKFGKFLPSDSQNRTECLNWLFWQMGSAPYLGGGFGHFFAYAKEKMQYPIDRYTMETKRQLDVLNQLLKNRKYLVGDEYTIADIANWTWYGQTVLGKLYQDSAEFLGVKIYEHVIRWAKAIDARPAVLRGCMVNNTQGDADKQLRERHSKDDFLK